MEILLVPPKSLPKCMQSREMNQPALSLYRWPRLSQRDVIIVLAKAKIKDADSWDLIVSEGARLCSFSPARARARAIIPVPLFPLFV